MSKADEMFEKLGFRRESNSSTIFYVQKIKEACYTERTIVINDCSKSFEGIFSQGGEHFPLCMNYKELQAINEKVKELCWNES